MPFHTVLYNLQDFIVLGVQCASIGMVVGLAVGYVYGRRDERDEIKQ